MTWAAVDTAQALDGAEGVRELIRAELMPWALGEREAGQVPDAGSRPEAGPAAAREAEAAPEPATVPAREAAAEREPAGEPESEAPASDPESETETP